MTHRSYDSFREESDLRHANCQCYLFAFAKFNENVPSSRVHSLRHPNETCVFLLFLSRKMKETKFLSSTLPLVQLSIICYSKFETYPLFLKIYYI